MSEDIASADALAEQISVIPAFTPVPRLKERSNGWKPEVQRAFIEALADTGSVSDACKRVGRSTHGAYHLRRSPGAEEFAAAWAAAVDHGITRLEDIAMDRAINGVEETLYSYGKEVGKRRRYNDRLLMFMLRNRAPDRFAVGVNGGKAAGSLKGLNAVGKMEKRRLKKKWRKQWEAEQSGAAAGRSIKKAHAIIDTKLDELRQRVVARHRMEWRTLSPETRAAYRHYEDLRARDLRREVEIPDWAESEEDIEAAAREWAEKTRRAEAEEEAEPVQALPAPVEVQGDDVKGDEDAAPRARTVKDQSWD